MTEKPTIYRERCTPYSTQFTVGTLINALEKLDPEGLVLAYDPDAQGYCPVSGFLYGGQENEILLQTDDNG